MDIKELIYVKVKSNQILIFLQNVILFCQSLILFSSKCVINVLLYTNTLYWKIYNVVLTDDYNNISFLKMLLKLLKPIDKVKYEM